MNETLTFFNSQNTFFEAFNLKEKVYPNGLVKLKKYSFDTFKGRNTDNIHNGKSTEKQLDMYLKKRIKERREKIIDLAFSNSWEYFITLTFNPKNKKYFPKGYSHERAIELLTMWLDTQRHKNKYMRYIVVSEFHKESGNLHFHGLFSCVSWNIKQAINSKSHSPIIINNVPIYNLLDYKLGFTTISYIQDTRKVSFYLSKYITKDLVSIPNKKVFWYSRNLLKPLICYRYVNCSLLEQYSNINFNYYNKFNKLNSSIEVGEYQKT